MSGRCIANECLGTTGFSYTLSLINGKYKMTILYTLMEFGVVRFNEMKKYIGEISYKTLSTTLKELEADGLVHREEYPQIPPKVEYSLSEIGENFGITRQGARDAIKHGETALRELEEKVGFAARYRRVQQTLEELEQLVIDARFECTGPNARLTTTEYAATLNKMLGLIRSIDEVNES